jgi:hypothetical protein
VLRHVLGAHRQKRAWADVEYDGRQLDAVPADSSEEILGEVQPGRGRGNTPFLPGKDRLVPLAVAGRVRAPDVGRQGNVPVPFDVPADIVGQQRNQVATVGPIEALRHTHPEAIRDRDLLARAKARCGAKQRLPGAVVLQSAHEQHLHTTARSSPAEQTRRQNPRPVENEEVARVQELDQITEDPVAQASVASRENQQARGVPFA